MRLIYMVPFITIVSAVVLGLNLIESTAIASSEIIVERALEEAVPAKTRWNLEEKLAEADAILGKIELKVGTSEISYTESLVSYPGLSRSTVKRKEQEKEIALALLNVGTGDIKTVIITKRGGQLIAPAGYDIDINERVNGIRWNRWNTDYKVPEGFIVIRNSYPELTGEIEKKIAYDSRGRKKTIYQPKIEKVIYTPYSSAIHSPEMVQAGIDYTKDIVKQAHEKLKGNQVSSRTSSDKFISDLAELKPEFFEALPVIEQTDMAEFILDSNKTIERVFVIIGANKEKAFARTGSFAGALGWVQYTKRTYNTIRRLYPKAGLIKDFKLGAADHLNSMTAAILLYDYNLALFKRKINGNILAGSSLEEYLAAAYNGGTARITDSLNASIIRRESDWIGRLKQETKGYIVKLRTLRAG